MHLRKLLIYSISGILLLISGSCSIEEQHGGTPDMIYLDVPLTRVPDPTGESLINTARMIVVRSAGQTNGGQVVVNTNTPFNGDLDKTWKQFRELVPVGYIDIYLFANELASWNLASYTIGTTFSLGTAESKIFDLTDVSVSGPTAPDYPVVNGTTHPIPMFLYHKDVRVDQAGNMTKSGVVLSDFEVERIFAKIQLHINCSFSDLPGSEPIASGGTGTHISIDSVYIQNLPKRSWLVPAAFTSNASSNFFTGHRYSPLNTSFSLGTAIDLTDGLYQEYVFYIPEYLITDITKRTTLVITASKNVYPSNKFHYKIVLGNGITTNTWQQMFTTTNAAHLVVSRNYCYTLNIQRITGFPDDATDPIVLNVVVVTNWVEHDIPIN